MTELVVAELLSTSTTHTFPRIHMDTCELLLTHIHVSTYPHVNLIGGGAALPQLRVAGEGCVHVHQLARHALLGGCDDGGVSLPRHFLGTS